MQKLLIKMWDTLIDKGVGHLLKPWQMKREGKVNLLLRKEELLMLAKTEEEIKKIRSSELFVTPISVNQLAIGDKGPTEEVLDLYSTLEKEKKIDHLRKEINLTKTLIFTEEELSSSTDEPNEEKITDEWFYRWRDYANEANNENLQRLWSKVLSGEIKQSGKSSLRTLDFLRNLSYSEAKDIEKLGKYVISQIIFKYDDLFKSKIDHRFLLNMEDLGLINGVNDLGLQIILGSVDKDKFTKALVNGKRALLVTHENPSLQLKLKCITVTKLGLEIISLTEISSDEEYLDDIKKNIINQGFECKIGDFVPLDNGQGRIDNLV